MGKARFKFNGGNGALLCSKCNTIIKTGNDFTAEEQKASAGEIVLEPQFCGRCKAAEKTADPVTVGKIYHLDLGSLAPVKVKVLGIVDENEVLVEYLNSWPGRTETLPNTLFLNE